MHSVFGIIFYLIILVIAITVHEFSHAWVAHLLGDITAQREGRLTLNPLVHIDPFFTLLLPLMLILIGSPVVFGAAKPVPFNPYSVHGGKWGAATIAIAGPFSNFLMAAVVGLYLRLIPIGGTASLFLTQFVLINLAFFIFNMLPLPPLDGSRVLYAIAPPALEDILERIERFGLLGIMLLLFLLYPIISPFIVSAVGGLATLLLGSNPL